MNYNSETCSKAMLKLKSKPDEKGNFVTIELSYAAARLSGTIHDAFDLDNDDDDDDDDDGGKKTIEMELARGQIDGPCLEKIGIFLNYYQKEKMKEIPENFFGGESSLPFNKMVPQQWYRDFVDNENLGPKPDQMMFQLVRAANYMNIAPLLNLTTLKVYFNLQGMDNYNQIKEYLHLSDGEEEER